MKIFVSLLVLLLSFITQGQAQTARQTKLDYQRGEKNAAVIELPFTTEIVEGAIKERLQSATVKEARLKGMQVFKGGRLSSTNGEVVDFYFKAERKGRREDSATVLYLILGRPGENVALRTLSDDFRIDDAQEFLNSLVPVVNTHKLETDIKRQEELVKKTEKNLSNLATEQKNLENRIRELQEKLAQNQRDQQTQQNELASQKARRDKLVSERK